MFFYLQVDLMGWMPLLHPVQYFPPDGGTVVRPLHGPFKAGHGGSVILIDAKPPDGIPYPQLGASSILFGVPLKRQDGVVVAQQALVPNEQLREPSRRGAADCPAVVLLQEEGPAGAEVSSKETAAGGRQLCFCHAQLDNTRQR